MIEFKKVLIQLSNYTFRPGLKKYSAGQDKPGIGITTPYDGKPATVGNGTMVALQVESQKKVQSVYKKAISLGAKDEGAPGPRGDSGFYAAYFRDLDGNKLNVFCFVKK